DAVDQTYAWTVKNLSSIAQGEIPLWDFGVQGGTSHIGEIQPAPYYPTNFLLAWLTVPTNLHAMELVIALHYVLAASFMHALLRTLGRSHLASFAGAMVYAFAGTVAQRPIAHPNVHAGMAWVPLVMLCGVHAMAAVDRRTRVAWTVFAGLALALCIHAGHMQ